MKRVTIYATFAMVVFSILFIVSSAQSKPEFTRKTDSFHVFPSVVTSDGWSNEHAVLVQDVSEDALYQDFNVNNSATPLADDERTSNVDTTGSPAQTTSSTQEQADPADQLASSTVETPAATGTLDTRATTTTVGSSDTPTTSNSASEDLDGSTDATSDPSGDSTDEDESSDEEVEQLETVEDESNTEGDAAFFDGVRRSVFTFFTRVTEKFAFVAQSTTTPVETTVATEESASTADADDLSSSSTSVSNSEFVPTTTESEVQQPSATSTDTASSTHVSDTPPANTQPESSQTSEQEDQSPTHSDPTLTLSDFSIPSLGSGQFITNVQLRLSFAAQQLAIASTSNPSLSVEYRVGDAWTDAGSISITEEVSNAINGGYFLLALPTITKTETFKELEVRITYDRDGTESKDIYIESAWLEIDTETFDRAILDERIRSVGSERLVGPRVHEFVDQRLDFRRTENPHFLLRYRSQRNIAVRFVRDLFGRDLADVRSLRVLHKGVGELDLEPQIDVTQDGLFTIQLDDAARSEMRPGEYTVELTVAEGGKTFSDSFDFQWGMLSINPDQTEYELGATSTISMGALTPNGNTLCNADLRLYIIDPNEFITPVPVSRSGECRGNNVTDVPDYTAAFVPDTSGTYEMYLERVDGDGKVISHTSDTFNVVEEHVLDVRRVGPTRIYPPAPYPMEITVSTDESFSGTLVEQVPAGFEIFDTDATIRRSDDHYELSWEFDLMAGTEKTFSYMFDAPDLSPFLYELGPAELSGGRSVVEPRENNGTSTATSSVTQRSRLVSDFTEHREWQIASDATGNMILFWDDGGSIPTDWTCLSCGSGTFYQRFAVGSSTYNNTGGTADHTHTASTSLLTSPDATVESGSGGPAIVTHNHTLDPGVSTESNLPSYRQLRVIQYTASAGEPATIPAGAIGIFDVASSSLPSGWNRYEAQDGHYIYGEDTPGTIGGSNTHTHGITGTTGGSTGGTARSRGGGTQATAATDGHTHGFSTTTGQHSNEPPYIEVVLAQLGSDAVPPNNLITMWTEDVPAGWTDVSSDPADPFHDRFLKASTTYSAIGGAGTHDHSDITGAQTDQPSATINGRSGTSGAAPDHTHSVNLTNFSTVNSLPPYVSAVFGKRIGTDAAFTQQSYRWYDNTDAQTPTDPWPAGGTDLVEREPITATGTPLKDGDVVRLRLNALVTNATATVGTTFKLQYASTTGVCNAAGAWTDVGSATSSEVWRGYDNGSVADHSTLSSTVLASTSVAETYEENGFATGTPNELSVNDVGEWDLVLEHNGAQPGTVYCFRMVESDDTPFFSYGSYPKLLTNSAPTAPTLSKLFDNEKTASTTPWFEFVTTDPEGEDLNYQIQVDNDHGFTSTVIDRNTVNHGSQFENLVTSSDKDPYTGGEQMRFLSQTSLSNGTTYYWRVRARDPDGSDAWGGWSTTRSFTIDTSLDASAWFQTEGEQFDTNALSGIESSGDSMTLITGSSTGSVTSTALDFDDGELGTAWGSFSWNDTETNGDISYQVEYLTDGATWELVPDSVLSGNSSGFGASPISLLDLDTDIYNEIRLRASFTDVGGSPSLEDWGIDWGYRIETPTIAKLFPNEKVGTTTPTFEFTTTDPQSDPLTYEVQWSTNVGFTASTTRISSSSPGFVNIDDGGDTDPFTSGETVQFTIQGADALTNDTTYWWRVRATDPTGADAFSFWTNPRSVTVATDTVVSTWFQTTQEQFDTNILSGTQALASDAVAVATTANEAMLVYGEGTEATPRYRQWDGSGWGAEGSLLGIDAPVRWAAVRAGTTREEYIAATLGTDGDVNVQVFSSGAWGDLQEVTASVGDVSARGFDVAYETLSGDGMIVYCDGDADPSYYTWDGSNWNSGGTINLSTTVECEWIRLASDPVSNEIIVLTRPSDGSTYEAQVWNGVSWGNSTSLGSVFEAAHEGMAVAYEESGGQALIVASDGNPGRFVWDSWNGSVWAGSSQTNLGNDFEWGDLVSNVGTDELALCYLDEDLDVGTIEWSGSAWGTFNEHTTDGNTKTDPPFACVYENSSGRDNHILTTYSDTTSAFYDSWNDATWAGGTQINSIGDVATMELERTGDGAILGLFLDDPNDSLLFSTWNGAAWSTTTVLENDVSVGTTPLGHPYDAAPRNSNKSGTTIVSPGINFDDGVGPFWQEMSWVDVTPGTSDILYSVQYWDGDSWEFIPNSDLPGNESGTSTSPIDLSSLSVSTYDRIRPHAALSCDGSDNCPTLQDWTIEWAEGITVSGTLQRFDQSTDVNSGTVEVAVNGVLQTGKTGSVSGGSWSITNVTTFPGDVVTVFVNGTTSAAEAVGVTRYDGSDNITGMQMYQEHLTLGSDDATSTPLTNADIGAYDVDNTEDVFIDLSGTTLSVCGDTGCGNARLFINASTTYQPGGTLDTHDIEIQGTFRPNGNTVYVGGSWENNATATMATSSVVFYATSTSETVDSSAATVASFNNVTFGSSTSAADWTLTSSFDVNGDLSVNEGTLRRGAMPITVAGDLSTGASGSWSGVGTTTFDGSGTVNWSDAHATPENVGAVVVNGASKNVTLSGNVGAESITIGGDDILDASASHHDITVYQGWTNTNTFVPRQGEVFFAATSTNKEITAGGDAFYDLTFNGAGGSWSFTESDLSVNNNVTIATGTVTMPTGTTTLAGSFDSVGGTFMHNNATILLTSSAAETIAASGTPFTNNFYTLHMSGSGSWAFLDTNATTSNDLIIQQGSVTLPNGTMGIGGSFANTGGTFAHNNGAVQFTSAGNESIDTNAAFDDLLFTGSGSWSFIDGSVTALGDLTVTAGTVTLPATTLTLGGSLTNSAALVHNSGEVVFNSSDAGETVDLGASALFDMTFNSGTGGWNISGNATATNAVTLTAASDLTLASGRTLSVGGIFTNSVGGASTTWAGSTLSLESGDYNINTKSDAGDTYETLRVQNDADISMWNSSASTYEIDPTGSLYSQDHAASDGELYIFGDYRRASGTEHWSYATDFDASDLSGGSERQAQVFFADDSSATFSSSTLSVVGSTNATTTVQNQGSGSYTISVSGGTTTMQYYDLADLGTSGLSLLASTTVTSMDDGAFTVAAAGGTALTLSSTTIDANPEKQIFRVDLSTTTAIAANNVTQTDGAPSSFWWFRDHSGNIDGESFDNDTGDPGSVRWDDSSLVITVSGTVYQADESTPLGGPTCGTGSPVRVVVEGGGTYNGACNGGDGSFSIPGVVVVGDPTVTVFLNDAAGGERAVAVTKTPTEDIDDLHLYEDRVITRHEDTEAMFIADMAAYDNSDDPDIPFAAATGTTDSLTVFNDNELHVWATTTFTPGGVVTLNADSTGNSYDGSLHLGQSSTFTGSGTTTYTVGGSITLEDGATFVPASSTVIMNATTTGKTITTESDEALTLHELQVTGVDGSWNINGNITATADIEVATGTVTGTGNITLTSGSFFGDGLVSFGGGTTTIERTNTLGGGQGWTFYDLTLGNGSVVGTTTPGSSATTSIDGTLTIETAHYLDAGGARFDLGGSDTVFVESGTFLEDTSRVRYSGTAATNILSTDYYDLTLDALAGSPTYTGSGLGVQVLNDLVVGNTATTTVDFDTNDPALNIDGDMTIGSFGTFISSDSGSFTIAGDYDNNGTFTASGGTLTFDSSISSDIAAGNSSFSTIVVDGSGTFTITENATATDAFTLTSAGLFDLGTDQSLAIGGTFTNGVGGGSTDWSSSTLYLYGGNNYEINASTTNEQYEILKIGPDTDIRMWNSDATTIDVNDSGSLYSQDHNEIDGYVFIYGDYVKTSGSDHWSYATDFDGADLSVGNEREVTVWIAENASSTHLGGELAVIGDANASTTIRNQGSGTYALRVGGNASTTWSYYEVRDTNASGVTFSGSPDVMNISNGDLLVSEAGGSGITVGGSVIDANPAKTFSQNIFATSSAISAFNVTATGTSVSSWRFTNHTGNLAGESFDSDPDGDPGYIVWDNSAANITVSGNVYSDEGSNTSTACDSSTNNIHLRVAGLTSYTTSCNGDGLGGGSGAYSISGVTYSPGDSIVVYIDGEAEVAATVTEDPVSNINNMDLYEDRVIVRHENTDPLSISDMATWDSADDGSIPFTVVSGSPDTLTLPADMKLLVWTNKTFEPGGNVTLSGGGAGADHDGTLELSDNATFDASNGESHSIGGSFISGSGASFEAETSTMTFTTTGASRTIDTNDDGFYDLTFNGSGSWTVTNNILSIGNDMTITSGSVSLPPATTTVSGTFENTGGSFDMTGGQIVFDSNAAETVRTGGSDLGTTTFNGSGSWTYLGGTATTTGDFIVNSGSVVAPTGTLAVGGDFVISSSANFSHNGSELRLYSDAPDALLTLNGEDLSAVTFAGSGTTTMTDLSVAILSDLTILDGVVELAATTTSVAGSFNNSGIFRAASGTVHFNASSGGNTVAAGGSDFYNVNFAGIGGGWTLTESATATNNFAITNAGAFTLGSGNTLAVGGMFTNTVGGSATTWSGTTLRINSGVGYPINTKSTGADQYESLVIGPDTDLRMWNSAATSTTVDPSSSLYSQDHNAVDGSLYIYGDYERTVGTDFWSYTTDFNGDGLPGGSERAVTVHMANGATTTFTGGTLQILGAAGATSTVQNQGSGTYTMDILGGTFNAQYYAFRDMDEDGLNLQGVTTVTSLSDGDFTLAVDGGSLITLSSTTLNQNASKVIQDVHFATTSAIGGTNVELIGTTPSAWTFTDHTGNLSGEAFDTDGGTQCGSVRWDDSSCLITEQSAYRWRSDDGGEGVPNSEWFDQDWSKRKRVTLTNNDASLYTDAVVELSVSYDSDMQSDFDDLRFTDASGTTTIDHFIATTTQSTDANVWVKVPTLAASDETVVYMYYGNGAATDGSNGTSTFIAFDNFEDGDIAEYSGDTGEFVVDNADAYERTYRLEASDPDSSRTQSGGMYNNSNVVSQGETIRYLQYIDTEDGGGDETCTLFATQSQTENYAVCLELFGTERLSISEDVLDNDVSGTVLASTTLTYATGWYEVEIDWGTDDTIFARLYQNDTLIATTSAIDGTYTSGGIGYSLWLYEGGWDLYTSRPLLMSEPSASFGFEQVNDGASWLTAVNTKVTSVEPGDIVRPRFVVENSGLSVSDQYRLEYAEKGNAPSCESVNSGDYAAVPPQASCSGSAICMESSSEFTNRASSTDLLGGDGTFTYGQIVEDPSNETDSITVGSSEFTELEYAIEATEEATDSNYCLRVTDAGSDLDSYVQVAEMELLFRPNITSLSLNGGLDISLSAGATTTVYATGTVSDLNGSQDLDLATSTIFRNGPSGVGESCTPDDNNCYRAATPQCSFTNCSGNSCEIVCSVDMYYFADPTDAGTFAGDAWTALLSVSDQGGSIATATAPSIDLITIRALAIDSTIDYGSLSVNDDTGSYNATTSIQNIGNDSIDVLIEGTDLTDGSSSVIPANEQRFATTTFTYSACTICSALSTSTTALELDLNKPTTTTPAITDEVYWGIRVPFGVSGSPHQGNNTFYATGD